MRDMIATAGLIVFATRRCQACIGWHVDPVNSAPIIDETTHNQHLLVADNAQEHLAQSAAGKPGLTRAFAAVAA